ncbi:MAG: SRPBCC domain-containing protein [Candidatus Binatia bacterium]
MIFSGRIDLDVPVAKTWDFLIDINKFSSCLPGLQEVKQIDDKTFDGVIAAHVGPISGKFSFRAMIVESKAPEQMVVKTEGTDSVTKSAVNADMTVDLHRLSENETVMDYRADIKIKGRLAILGDMVLRATATLILQEFTKRLRQGVGATAKA